MQFEPFLLSYAGLASIALTSLRVRRNFASSNIPKVGALRLLATILMSLAAWRAVHLFGPEIGCVAFTGTICISAIPLVLMLSKWPRVGISAGLIGGIAGLGALLFGLVT